MRNITKKIEKYESLNLKGTEGGFYLHEFEEIINNATGKEFENGKTLYSSFDVLQIVYDSLRIGFITGADWRKRKLKR